MFDFSCDTDKNAAPASSAELASHQSKCSEILGYYYLQPDSEIPLCRCRGRSCAESHRAPPFYRKGRATENGCRLSRYKRVIVLQRYAMGFPPGSTRGE